MLDTLLDIVALALLGGGLTLVTIGLYGMLRLDDILHQLHAAALITGPGVVLILLAAIGSHNAEVMTSAALVLLFVLVTSPLSAHAIAQAALRRDEEEE
jgi:multicomponent Na+:H+ antiporter subunit G